MPDVDKACARFEELGVEFVKKPDAGNMKGLAFIKVKLLLQQLVHQALLHGHSIVQQLHVACRTQMVTG